MLEITSIKISLDDNKGRKSSASWSEKDQATPDIVMGEFIQNFVFLKNNFKIHRFKIL